VTDSQPRNLVGLMDACDRALARLGDLPLPHPGGDAGLIADIQAVRSDAQRQLNLNGPAPRVLLAEDDVPTRIIYRVNLELCGFAVSEASDGAEALAAARAQPHNLLLLDGSLGQIDGWELTAVLQSDPRTRAIVIVFVSGHIDKAKQLEALERGATAYVTKPFDPTDLTDLALRLLAPGGPAAVHAAERRRVTETV
jgi:two-component system, chemotaxis family, chemotaxis protein CheY